MTQPRTAGPASDPNGERGAPEAAPPVDPAQPGAWWARWGEWSRLAGLTWDAWQTGRLPTPAIEAVAHRRLQQLVALARERSPLHRARLQGLPPGAVELAQLPVFTKRELMANFDEAATDPEVTRARAEAFMADPQRAGEPFLGRHALWTSSGSTGEPTIYVQDAAALATYDALEFVRFRGFDPMAMFAALSMGERYAMVGATGGHFAGNSTVERTRRTQPWLAGRVRMFSIMQPVDALARQLDEYQPTHLATYPTAACLLAERQRQGRLRLRPRQVWTGGEQLSEGARQFIEQTFGCPVRDGYGASEFLPLAAACPHGTLHVNADWVILEPVDAQHRPVPDGVASHTALLTNLANGLQPLIRYDLGDSVTRLPACACGSTLPAIRVEGRCDDVLTLRTASGAPVTLLPLALVTVLEDEVGVHRFQLVQDGPGGLELRLDAQEGDADTERRCQAALAGFLREQGAPDAGLRVTRTTLQTHQISGKLRRVIARQPASGSAP